MDQTEWQVERACLVIRAPQDIQENMAMKGEKEKK